MIQDLEGNDRVLIEELELTGGADKKTTETPQ
jgi:hypothetical protein